MMKVSSAESFQLRMLSLPSSMSPNLLIQLLTQICSSLTFLRGSVSMSMMYSSRVSMVSNTMRQMSGRHSLGSFLMFWPSIRLSVIVMFFNYGLGGTVFFRWSWEVCRANGTDIRGQSLMVIYLGSRGSLTFSGLGSLTLFLSALMSVYMQFSSSAESLYTSEVFGQNPQMSINKLLRVALSSELVYCGSQAANFMVAQVYLLGQSFLNCSNTQNLRCCSRFYRIYLGDRARREVDGRLKLGGGKNISIDCLLTSVGSLGYYLLGLGILYDQESLLMDRGALTGYSPSKYDTAFLLRLPNGSKGTTSGMGMKTVFCLFLALARLVNQSTETRWYPLGSRELSLATWSGFRSKMLPFFTDIRID